MRSSPAANRILKMADILGATTRPFSLLLKHFPHFQIAYYMPISGDSLRPDLVFISKNFILCILELTVGFESNILINSDRKASKYSSLILDLKHAYSDVKFVDLSMSTISIMGKSSELLLLMLDDLNLDKPTQKYLIRKVLNIAIRCTYYIFCCRNRPWSNPNLLDF